MPATLRGAAAVAGVGLAGIPFGKGRTHLELIADAVNKALDDSGLSRDDIDGLFTTNLVNFMPGISVAEYLGIRPRWFDSSNVGGSSFVHYAASAALAIQAGLCKVALLTYGSDAGSNAPRPLSAGEPLSYEAEYDAPFPIAGVALAAARHMAEYGTTRRHLAEVALAARDWAALDPALPRRDAVTLDQMAAAPTIVDPFSLYDCGAMTDGAAAVLMVSASHARDLKRKPVYFLGGGSALSHRRIVACDDLTTTAAVQSGARAYEMAGLGPQDVDLLQLYDGFTIYPILFLEDLGFCRKGEGGPFVSGGTIGPGGKLPVNTNGGSLCSVHPGMYGLFLIAEAVRQLRGDAGAAQVRDAHVCLCHGNGGHLSSQCTAIFGDEIP